MDVNSENVEASKVLSKTSNGNDEDLEGSKNNISNGKPHVVYGDLN